MPIPNSSSLPFSPDRTVSWIHIGDTHLTRAAEQNEIDLGRIIDQINALYAHKGIDFVFVPGDIADDGSVVAYQAFRRHLDRLNAPWFGIVGDHDVHEQSFENFQKYIGADLYSSFAIGPYEFIRLNAFSTPRPDSFDVSDEQLQWLRARLKHCADRHGTAIIFLHCYPSDLKQGGHELTKLLRHSPVLLVDMGHTHYNELSNDGKVIYSATRSTGQIEEGPVGYSVATVDGNCFSWHFVPLDSPSVVCITHPTDDRLHTTRISSAHTSRTVPVHAKVWSASPVKNVHARLGQCSAELHSRDGVYWEGSLDGDPLEDGTHELQVFAIQATGKELTSSIRVVLGPRSERTFLPIDQDNAIGEWRQRGILGTQLGPNKNGRKW